MEENEVENTWKNCALKIFISCQKLQRYMIMSWYAKGPSVTIFRQRYIFLCLKEFICSANLQENTKQSKVPSTSEVKHFVTQGWYFKLWHKPWTNWHFKPGSYILLLLYYDIVWQKMFIFMAKTKSNWKIIDLSTQNTISTSYSWFLLLLHISHTI